MKNTQIVHIDLGERSYDIHIGSGLLENPVDFLPFDMKGRKAFIITDTNVTRYADALKQNLDVSGASVCKILTLPFGEGTKSFEQFQHCHEWMLENNIHRNSIVFALGGGVIGDLAGFAAATVMRGVTFVQIPTTILSQVDSSVGGKTGINTSFGKNLVGSFYQPAAVIADIETLKTLPKREILAGYAEIVKYGLLGDVKFFEWLELNGEKVVTLDPDALTYAIEKSCKAKAAIVAADEREGGKRALLNLGHTFGHALESVAGYDGTLLHGEAVSIGMVLAFDLSARLGLCTPQDVMRVTAHLEKLELPVRLTGIKTTADDLMKAMCRDKKAVDDKMIFILVKNIGEAFISQDVSEDLVMDVLNDALTQEGT